MKDVDVSDAPAAEPAEEAVTEQLLEVRDELAAQEAKPPPAVTTPKQWAARALPILVQVPSGETIKVKRPDFHLLLLDEVITVDQMQSLIGRQERTRAMLHEIGMTLLPHIVIEPVIVRRNGHAPADDLMVAEDIPDGDVVALALWAIGRMPLPEWPIPTGTP